MPSISERLAESQKILQGSLEDFDVARLLEIIGLGGFPRDFLDGMRLYTDYLPKAEEIKFTSRQRALQFIWDSLDKSPACLIVNFAIPFRRMLAKQAFKCCGRNFIAEENVRFNLGPNISIGDDVFINRGTYIDSKGGFSIGNFSGIAEGVTVFTHGHSESTHSERTYAPVKIGNYAKIYAYAVLLPGVTVGDEAIVATRSLVTKDVEPGTVVAGTPAVAVRKRKNEGRHKDELGRVWFHKGAFQDD